MQKFKPVRKRVSVDCSVDVALTATNNRVQQSFKKAVDIDVIVSQYIRANGKPPPPVPQGYFRDISEVGDFGAAMDRVIKGRELFSSLDARIRDSFRNDPEEFIRFAADPANEAKVRQFAFGEKPPAGTPERPQGKEALPPPAEGAGEPVKATAGDAAPAPTKEV